MMEFSSQIHTVLFVDRCDVQAVVKKEFASVTFVIIAKNRLDIRFKPLSRLH
jgi:hypothetical protein